MEIVNGTSSALLLITIYLFVFIILFLYYTVQSLCLYYHFGVCMMLFILIAIYLVNLHFLTVGE